MKPMIVVELVPARVPFQKCQDYEMLEEKGGPGHLLET